MTFYHPVDPHNFTFSALLPGMGRLLYKIGITGWPKESVEFYEDTGKALIDERLKKSNSVSFYYAEGW